MTDGWAMVVVAAGDGVRLGADRPKALVEVAGEPMVRRAVAAVAAAGVPRIVVVHHPDHATAFEAALGGLPVTRLVPGGATRGASVRAGVAAALATGHTDVVAVHDAARCLTPSALIRDVYGAVAGPVVAAAPGRPVADTLKVCDDDGFVAATRDRAGLWAVHTPQAVATAAWEALLAWDGADLDATDDLGLVERARAAGILTGDIRLLRSDGAALKLTWPADLEVATALLERGTVGA